MTRKQDEYSSRLSVRSGSRARVYVGLVLGVITLGSGACGPTPEQIRLARAMSSARHELQPEFAENLNILDQYRLNAALKNELVLYGMCETSLAMIGGNRALADRVAKETHLAIQKYQDVSSEQAAAIGHEGVKFFKGEPHERALLAFYAGLACYMDAQYNDARIFFAQSLLATATRDDDMSSFRGDFQLGHYWLGRAYLKLDQQDNARIAFAKAAVKLAHGGEDEEIRKLAAKRSTQLKQELQGEAICYQNATSGEKPVEGVVSLSDSCSRANLPTTLMIAADVNPIRKNAETLEAFLDPGFQAEVNLIIIVELGQAPIKYLGGRHAAYDEYLRVEYRERSVDIYVDGYRAGAAYCLLDTYHQAATRGVQTRRSRQTGKAVTKEILSHIPYVGDIASYWDVRADARYWPSLPGEFHVYAANVTPGLHTITFKFSDINGQYLPRYDFTRHYLLVPTEGETILLVYSLENQDNAYLLALRQIQ